MNQFLNGPMSNRTLLLSKLDINIFNFVMKATRYARRCFKQSFKDGGFYKSPGKWKPRKKHYNHPILMETGQLYKLAVSHKKRGRRHIGRVNTTESFGARSGKKNRGYAAVHNDPLASYTVNQYSSAPPVKRQFMGHNKEIYRTINRTMVPLIFKGIM